MLSDHVTNHGKGIAELSPKNKTCNNKINNKILCELCSLCSLSKNIKARRYNKIILFIGFKFLNDILLDAVLSGSGEIERKVGGTTLEAS